MLSDMKPFLASGILLFLFLAAAVQSAGQVASLATRDVTSNSDVLFDVTVLGFPRGALGTLGIALPEPGRGAPGLAVPLQDGQEKVLIADPRAIAVHSLKLRATSGNLSRVRIDTRVPAPNISADSYFEAGIGLEVTPRVVLGRHIAMTAATVVQIRRGSRSAGSLPSVLYETDQIRHEIQVPDGKPILLGGFITAADSNRLPSVPMTPGNPILNYVFSKVPGKGDQSEIVILLTPRLTGAVSAGAANVPPAAPVNATLSSTFPSVPTPVLPPAPKAEPPPVTAVSAPKAEPPVVTTAPATAMRQLILPAPVSPGTSAPTSTRPFYSVQVGAFDSSVNAVALVGELKKKFEGVYVDKAPSGSTPYRVRVGRLSDIAAARQLQGKLEDQGFDSFVVFTNSP